MDIVLSYPDQVFISLFLAFIFGVMATFKPNYAFYAVCLFLPTYILRIRGTVIPTNVLELLIVMTVMGWLGYSLGHKKRIYLPEKRFLAGIGLIFAGALISLAFSKNEFFFTGAGIFKGFIIEPIIFSLALYSAIRQNLVKKEHIIKMLVWSAFCVAIVSLVGIFIPSAEFWTFDNRLRGFYLSPNHLAMYLAPLVPLVGYLIFTTKKREKLLYLTCGIFVLTALFLTKSFGAWLALAATVVIAVIILRKNFNPKIIKVMMPVGLILSVIFGFIFREELASFLLNPERSSWASRLQIWNVAFAVLKDNPLLGIGMGTFQEYYLAYQQYFSPYLEWAVPQPHNLILAFWLQTGIIGLVGFLWLVICFFKKVIKITPPQKFEMEQTVLACSVIIILIHGFIDTTIWKNDLSVIFWVVFMFFVSDYKQRTALKGSEDR